jgi:hypothetical protein
MSNALAESLRSSTIASSIILLDACFFLEKFNHQLSVDSLEIDDLLFVPMALCQK